MRDVELEEIKEYATEDADITFQLKNYLPLSWQNRNHKARNWDSVSKSISWYGEEFD
jgi:hypothetical protein